jgi:hypothetical protein
VLDRGRWTVGADRDVGALGGSSHALFVQYIAFENRDLRLGDVRRVAHDSCYRVPTVDQLPENTAAGHPGGPVRTSFMIHLLEHGRQDQALSAASASSSSFLTVFQFRPVPDVPSAFWIRSMGSLDFPTPLR